MSEFLNSSTIQRLSTATNITIESNDDVLSAINVLLSVLEASESIEPLEIKHTKHKLVYCKGCGCQILSNGIETMCLFCKDQELFEQVKEFIRSNDVKEYDVATKFNISVSRVRHWIREGRIQYKEADTNKIITHCIVCGEPIRFGTVCSRCLKTQSMSGTEASLKVSDSGNMWFLDDKRND